MGELARVSLSLQKTSECFMTFSTTPPMFLPMELVGNDLKGRAVIGDDKDHSKIWVADQVDLNRYVTECVEIGLVMSRCGSGRLRFGASQRGSDVGGW